MNVDNLSYEAVEMLPQRHDWSGSDMWVSLESAVCEECGVTVHDCECPNCGAIMYLDGPMMNFFYPLPDRFKLDEYIVDKLVNLPLCLVQLNDKWGLALTGGGMDLSWSIAEAHLLLGYYPPFHFCHLPKMAGNEKRENYREIITGCIKTCEAIEMRAARAKDSLRAHLVLAKESK